MFPKNVIRALSILLAVIVCGTLGYRVLEPWSLLDSLYQTVITVFGVGLGAVPEPSHPLTRVFTIFLIMTAMGTIVYAVSSLTSFVVEGELHSYFRRTKMERNIENPKDHYIVCGCGQTGRSVADEFKKVGVPFVIIDTNEESLKKVEMMGILTVLGDATKDDILKAAGITRAKGLLAALDSNVDNLFIVLSSRELNPGLFIIARATDESSERKLLKAGADKVISPNQIGGKRMASLVVRPEVVTFLDVMMRSEGEVLRVEEAIIPDASPIAGKALRDIGLPQKTGLIVIAVKKAEHGKYLFNPGSTTTVESNDVLIVLGNPNQVDSLRKLVQA